MAPSDRIRIRSVEVLSQDPYALKKTTFDYRRRDGSWQTLTRQTYDHGNAAAVLLYNRGRRTVVLTRQFRLPAYLNGLEDGMLIEACAGLLDQQAPEARIKHEAEEETGYRLGNVTKLFEAYMSPGSVTEKIHFFTAEYDPEAKAASGGGKQNEGEDIEVLELPFEQAMAMIGTGEIQDAKTILLLQHAKLHGLFD
jgi:nudix-type nucleoside diphosphatase (YffH/AdpP family)